MKNTTKNNQQGMASIMFAMFLVLGISLLAIGFATLVRNDQRQALDKTLSNQAQYAAESAINSVQAYLKANPTITEEQSDCGGAGQTPTFTDGITVTCLTWNPSPAGLNHANISTTPWSTPLEPNSGSKNQLVITWISEDGKNTLDPTVGTSQLKLGGNVPTLRVVAASSLITDATVTYINPFSIAGGSQTGSGSIVNGLCTNTTIGNAKSCTATISIPSVSSGSGRGYLAISALNGTAKNVDVKFGGGGNFIGSQAIITANAKSQDVSKRLVAYVSLPTSTWQPGFVASADALCKNYKLGLGGNDQAGPVTDTLCPTN